MRPIRKWKTISLILAYILALLLLSHFSANLINSMKRFLDKAEKSDSIVSSSRQILVSDKKRSPNDTIYVLFGNEYFGEFWGYSEETTSVEDFKLKNCPHTNCVITFKKDLLPHPHDYDAILFHAWEQKIEFPKTRSPHQLYVFVSKEAPNRIPVLQPDPNMFNLTMTYRLDSDIPWFYGLTVDLLSGKTIAPALNVNWKKVNHDYKNDNIVQTFRNKTKTASWVVSNCNYAPSRRNDLVKALQQYIDVDVYGHCGPLKCPKDRCEAFLDENYKFYFAFENALCDDYLSEKVYKILETNMIPVIYSGADLPRFLPDKSYIDANSFATVDELGKYLKFLSENPKEFVKYFWWRDLYKTLSYFYHVTFHQMCNICVKLNDPNFKTKRQSYTDIRKWYTENACYDPHIQF